MEKVAAKEASVLKAELEGERKKAAEREARLLEDQRRELDKAAAKQSSSLRAAQSVRRGLAPDSAVPLSSSSQNRFWNGLGISDQKEQSVGGEDFSAFSLVGDSLKHRVIKANDHVLRNIKSTMALLVNRVVRGNSHLTEVARGSFNQIGTKISRIDFKGGFDTCIKTALRARNGIIITATLMNEHHQDVLFKKNEDHE